MGNTLIVTRGLPGAGKTTRARHWVESDPSQRARVNRDDMRDMLHGGWLGTPVQEEAVSIAAHTAVEALLRAGRDVVCDDTNLLPDHVELMRRIAVRCAVGFEIWDMTDVPPEVCVQRDEERGLAGGRYIGEKQIFRMWDQHREATNA